MRVNDAPAVFECGGLLEREGDGGGGAACTTVGVMFRNDLNPTWIQVTMHVVKPSIEEYSYKNYHRTLATTSPTSLKSAQRPIALRARKSSISRVPML